MKKMRGICCLLGLGLFLASLPVSRAGEVIWFPLYGSSFDGYEPIGAIAQIGSEVHLSVGIHFFADSCELPSNLVPVEFPTLFVVGCDYGFDRTPDVVISSSTTSGTYDYDIGNGWIFHRKGFANCAPVSKSLGWIYIRKYPWVYFIDGGWRWVVEAGITENSNAWWFYQPGLGWFWTT